MVAKNQRWAWCGTDFMDRLNRIDRIERQIGCAEDELAALAQRKEEVERFIEEQHRLLEEIEREYDED